MKKQLIYSKPSLLIISLSLLLLLWSVLLYMLDLKVSFYNLIYNVALALLPMIGGVIGVIRTKQWGGVRSLFGKIILFLSLALFAWSAGTWIWLFYTVFLNIAVPYPSFADLFYCMYYPLVGVGTIFLVQITTKKGDASPLQRLNIFFVPIIMSILTYYYIFMVIYGGSGQIDNPLKLFVDLAYPMGDLVIFTIVAITSGEKLNFLGIRLKIPMTMIFIAILVGYVADFYFTYSTSVGSYYNGALSDYIFALEMTLLSLGIIFLQPDLLKDNGHESQLS